MDVDVGPDVARAREVALELLATATDGPGLDARMSALVGFAVAATPSTLDRDGIARHAAAALDAGSTVEELTEAMLLASAIGMHGLHEAPQVLSEVLKDRSDSLPELSGEAQSYRQRLLADRYWQRLDGECPAFLDSTLRLSEQGFRSFVDYIAIPWESGPLAPKEKELIYVSIDTMPTHRYLPGMRFHIGNALALGATRQELIDVLDISAAAGPSRGIE
ncbi:MAG: carboxymuconolactone decarboxylase family protein [Gaiellaceae bacterium]